MASKEALGCGRNKEVTADVVVVGGGPGGSVAAKNCAQRGMHTLLLEKQKLPRRKVCSGMVVSNMAHAIIDKEFGAIPEEVLTDPPYLLGFMCYTLGYKDRQQEVLSRVTNAWRSDLDYWMNQKAKKAGAEIWDETLVTDVIQESDRITLKVRRLEQEHEIQSRFVVGADGAASVTRKRLFPSLNVGYVATNVEIHPGTLELDRRYWHTFISGSSRTTTRHFIHWFAVIHKKGCFQIEASNEVVPIKEAVLFAKHTLAEKRGFDPNSKPLWTDGTVMPILSQDLYLGKFIPAKGNALLAGDAGGIVTPGVGGLEAGGEGINSALKSGLLAASAIINAADTSREAASIYLTKLQPMIEILKTIATNYDYYQSNRSERENLLDQLI